MIRSFIGAVIGGAAGWSVGLASVAMMFHGDFGMCVMIGLGSGCVVGSIIGATGAIVQEIRSGKSPANRETN